MKAVSLSELALRRRKGAQLLTVHVTLVHTQFRLKPVDQCTAQPSRLRQERGAAIETHYSTQGPSKQTAFSSLHLKK